MQWEKKKYSGWYSNYDCKSDNSFIGWYTVVWFFFKDVMQEVQLATAMFVLGLVSVKIPYFIVT